MMKTTLILASLTLSLGSAAQAQCIYDEIGYVETAPDIEYTAENVSAWALDVGTISSEVLNELNSCVDAGHYEDEFQYFDAHLEFATVYESYLSSPFAKAVSFHTYMMGPPERDPRRRDNRRDDSRVRRRPKVERPSQLEAVERRLRFRRCLSSAQEALEACLLQNGTDSAGCWLRFTVNMLACVRRAQN